MDDVGFVLSGALKGVEAKRVKTHVVEDMRILCIKFGLKFDNEGPLECKFKEHGYDGGTTTIQANRWTRLRHTIWKHVRTMHGVDVSEKKGTATTSRMSNSPLQRTLWTMRRRLRSLSRLSTNSSC